MKTFCVCLALSTLISLNVFAANATITCYSAAYSAIAAQHQDDAQTWDFTNDAIKLCAGATSTAPVDCYSSAYTIIATQHQDDAQTWDFTNDAISLCRTLATPN